MHLRSKLTSEMRQKVASLVEKTEQNSLKVPTLPSFFFFFQKTAAFIAKLKTLIDLLL